MNTPKRAKVRYCALERLEDRRLLACVVPDNTCFAVIGDYGAAGDRERDVASLVHSWNPDLIITTGDNNYPRGAAATIDENIGQYYQQFIHPYAGSYGEGSQTNKFFPSLGNHDWRTSGAGPYLDYFTLPGNERYYNFEFGSVEFFAIDSDESEPDGTLSTSKQAAWLQRSLAASAAVWKIVYFHHSPYSSGPHGSTTRMQWPFREWGATAVLTGHDHIYERIVREGFPYFVNGAGGNSLYRLATTVDGSEVQYNTDYGAMLVDASDRRITFQFITRRGEIIDRYTLTGDGPLPSLSIATADGTAAEGGSGTATFLVTRTGDIREAISIGYVVEGTATNGTDFRMLDGTATIPAGSSDASFSVTPLDDALAEGPETVVLSLSHGSSYNLSPRFSATATIVDDEIPGRPAVIERRVDSGSDDAEEEMSGEVSLTSKDLDLGAGGDSTVGLRFQGVTIPRQATIISAYVQFQADKDDSVPASLRIWGEATGDATPFSSVSESISSRAETTAISWDPPPWTEDGPASLDQRTPDLSAMIQQIVARPDWSSGNAMVIVITGTGVRTAESYDGKPVAAPLLRIAYWYGSPPTATNLTQRHTYLEDTAMVPFDNIEVGDADLDQTITARLTLIDPSHGALSTGAYGATTSTYDPVSGEWQAIGTLDDVNAALADVAFLPAADNDRDSAIISHVEDPLGAGPVDGMITLVAMPVNDPPRAAGISNVAASTHLSSTTIDLFAAFEDLEDEDDLIYTVQSNTNPSLFTGIEIDNVLGTLTLVYSSNVVGAADITVRATDDGSPPLFVETTFSVTVTRGANRLEIRVSSSADDAEEKESGSVSLTSSDLELVFDDSDQVVGIRFNRVTIPAGATILSAHIQFQTDKATAEETHLTIYGADMDDAAPFVDVRRSVSLLDRTSASVLWSPPPWSPRGAAGPDQRTPNIAAVIQEIVDRPGWSGGNSLAVIITGTGKRIADSYDGDASGAPMLVVEFSAEPTEPFLPGDSNRDGVFNPSDLVAAFQAGEFEDQITQNSTWEEGDWNGDGEFDSSDLVLAFQYGHYVAAASSETVFEPVNRLDRCGPVGARRPRGGDPTRYWPAATRVGRSLEPLAVDGVFCDGERAWGSRTEHSRG